MSTAGPPEKSRMERCEKAEVKKECEVSCETIDKLSQP